MTTTGGYTSMSNDELIKGLRNLAGDHFQECYDHCLSLPRAAWCSECTPHIEARAVILSAVECIEQKQAENTKLRSLLADADARVAQWIYSPVTPDIPEGAMRQFLVSVRRSHNGKCYVFTADYLNNHFLRTNEWGDPEANDDGEKAFTGWHLEQINECEDAEYVPLLSDGDELIAWCEKPAAPPLPSTPSKEQTSDEA